MMQAVRNYCGVVVILVWGLAPFYWMVVTALRDKDHTFDTTPWPTHVTLDNFGDALATDKGNDFLGAIGNSLLVGAVTTFLAVLVGVFTAYAIARLDFRAKGIVTGIVLAASMFPGIALVTPLFQLFGDGATRGQAFRLVLLPLAAPALFTTAILAFIATWNEFMLAKQLSSNATEPVTVAIARFSGPSAFEYPYAAIMAAGTLVTIPLVIMVLVFQRRIVAGLTAGGVKA